MFFYQLPTDMILYIWSFMETNKEMNSLIRTCKSFKKLGCKYGHIKSIKFGMHTDYMNFIKLYNSRNEFLNKLTMDTLDNPVSWIQGPWPREMIFNRCYMGNNLIDPPVSKTRILVVRDLYRNTYLCINWAKLPELRVLDIYTSDMDFTGLEKCVHLKWIRIDINSNLPLPKFFQRFTKLKFIAVSMVSCDALNFVSEKLKTCFILKRQEFKSASKLVPKRHLEVSAPYINIQCLKR